MSDSEEYAFSGEEDEVEMGEDEVEEEAEEQSDDDESIRNGKLSRMVLCIQKMVIC